MLSVLKAAQGAKKAKEAFDDPTKGGAVPKGLEGAPVVLFNSCKGETHHHKSGYKQLFRRLRSTFRPGIVKDELNEANLEGADILIFGAPTQRFNTTEFQLLRTFIAGGGSVLVMASEGGESNGTNINFLLEEYGISVNSDCVVRTVYHKYTHPKEVLISDGVLNRAITKVVGKGASAGKGAEESQEGMPGGGAGDHPGSGEEEQLNLVYPHGATLTVQKPAVSILSSGKIAYPMDRPIGAVWHQKGAGRLAVVGSAEIFEDAWLDKEENNKLMDFLFRWLKRDSKIELYHVDADEPDVAEYQQLPDTEALSERLRCCLQESEPLPRDFTTLFDDALFKFDTGLVPEAVGLYEKLNVKKAPLTLIAPQFETPLPPLQPAVFPPALREPPAPALDMFDLDEMFASERVRLAHLTNKCAEGSDEDIEYYLQEGANILDVRMPGRSVGEARGAEMLVEVLKQIVKYKMSDRNHAAAGGGMGIGMDYGMPGSPGVDISGGVGY
eukprot:CAMPEP_0182873168 /NCGR_PEP_ID=MMETSP0034_2-20130328/12154_1 /TAXON_ID=156128 /ORGANISM="Nephroselmis pyriformis, Strain CCMP717" /LENGTH=498 /DNA_ID=CAMNT_0025005799 /DNA_START=149 /DNA_END=1645 /DNA_ORIENTATION=-